MTFIGQGNRDSSRLLNPSAVTARLVRRYANGDENDRLTVRHVSACRKQRIARHHQTDRHSRKKYPHFTTRTMA